jgi:hypothetical protein
MLPEHHTSQEKICAHNTRFNHQVAPPFSIIRMHVLLCCILLASGIKHGCMHWTCSVARTWILSSEPRVSVSRPSPPRLGLHCAGFTFFRSLHREAINPGYTAMPSLLCFYAYAPTRRRIDQVPSMSLPESVLRMQIYINQREMNSHI